MEILVIFPQQSHFLYKIYSNALSFENYEQKNFFKVSLQWNWHTYHSLHYRLVSIVIFECYYLCLYACYFYFFKYVIGLAICLILLLVVHIVCTRFLKFLFSGHAWVMNVPECDFIISINKDIMLSIITLGAL